MPYNLQANTDTPALIIYLLDMSVSMNQPLGGQRRIDVVTQALTVAVERLISLSTKGMYVVPRYRIAMLSYSDLVYTLLPDNQARGIKTITEIGQMGMPPLRVMRTTDTARAFEYVEEMLRVELPSIQHCPAPLVCHMTDGEYTGADPEPSVRRIMAMETRDGKVLVENIFISDTVLPQPIADPKQWPGILPSTKLGSDYADKLRAISSPLPESYSKVMAEQGYQMSAGALMMLPGMSPELVEMGFVMSTATPVTP